MDKIVYIAAIGRFTTIFLRRKDFEVYDKVRFQMVKLVEYGKSFKELVDMYTNYQVPRYA